MILRSIEVSRPTMAAHMPTPVARAHGADALVSVLPHVSKSQPTLTHVSRLIGSALTCPAAALVCRQGRVVYLSVQLPAEVNVSCFVLDEGSETDDGALLHLPGSDFQFSQAALASAFHLHSVSRLMFAAVSDEVIPSIKRVITLHGRAINFREPCRTWEMSRELWEAIAVPWSITSSQQAAASRLPLLDLLLLAEPAYNGMAMMWQLPHEFSFGRLDPSDAPTVNNNWKYRAGVATEDRMREMIQQFPTACVRVRATGDPVSWAFVRPDGSIGILHTLDEYRGRALAAATVKCLMVYIHRWLALLTASRAVNASSADTVCVTGECVSTGNATSPPPAMPVYVAQARLPVAAALPLLLPYCHIKTGNEASEKLFARLGFVPINACSWLASQTAAPRMHPRPLDVHSAREWEDVQELLAATSCPLDLPPLLLPSYSGESGESKAPHASLTDLKTMSQTGVFFVAYELNGAPASTSCSSDTGLTTLPGVETIPFSGLLHVASASPSQLAAEGVKQTGESDTLVACVHLTLGAHTDRYTARLDMLTVRPEFQHVGVGQRLLDFVECSVAASFCVAGSASPILRVQVPPTPQYQWLRESLGRLGYCAVAEPASTTPQAAPVVERVCMEKEVVSGNGAFTARSDA